MAAMTDRRARLVLRLTALGALASDAIGLFLYRQPDGVVSGGLGRRREDRTDRKIRNRLPERFVDLLRRVRRQADDRIRTDEISSRRGRQIVLADVHAAGAGEPGDVGAIVDDRERSCTSRLFDDRRCRLEQPSARRALGADLKEASAARQAGRGEIDQCPAGALRDVGIEDYVERRNSRSRDSGFGVWDLNPFC